MVPIDAQQEVRHMARAAGVVPVAADIPEEVIHLVDEVANICGVVADQGGGWLAMIHAVKPILCREPEPARRLATRLTQRCAAIAACHDPDDEEGPGDDIRSAFGEL